MKKKSKERVRTTWGDVLSREEAVEWIRSQGVVKKRGTSKFAVLMNGLGKEFEYNLYAQNPVTALKFAKLWLGLDYGADNVRKFKCEGVFGAKCSYCLPKTNLFWQGTAELVNDMAPGRPYEARYIRDVAFGRRTDLKVEGLLRRLCIAKVFRKEAA